MSVVPFPQRAERPEVGKSTPGRATIAVLEADPNLGRLLGDDERHAATHALTAQTHVVQSGQWSGDRPRDRDPQELGLLLLDGLVVREVALADNVSAELLGPGDIVRPWQPDAPEQLVPYGVRWMVLETVRFAVLDGSFARAAARFPAVGAMVADRFAQRAQRLALMQAIAQLNGVDRRLLTLYWHLAERWGRVTPDGVVVDVSIPHRLLAELVGARRPTVSSALTRLAETGELVRRPDHTLLLSGAPAGRPSAEPVRDVHVRTPASEQAAFVAELRARLDALRADQDRHQTQLDVLRERTSELAERTLR